MWYRRKFQMHFLEWNSHFNSNFTRLFSNVMPRRLVITLNQWWHIFKRRPMKSLTLNGLTFVSLSLREASAHGGFSIWSAKITERFWFLKWAKITKRMGSHQTVLMDQKMWVVHMNNIGPTGNTEKVLERHIWNNSNGPRYVLIIKVIHSLIRNKWHLSVHFLTIFDEA